MRIRSIFGPYADRLQAVIDNSLNKFAPNWYTRYFPFAPAQNTLTFTSVIGRARIEAAASVVNRDSATPLRSRQGLEKLTGEIPAIKEMFSMTESDYRDFLTMQQLNLDDATKRNQLLDFLFGDVKKVGDSAHKRLDIMCLEAVSTGKISLSIDNNPDGLVLADSVDLLMPSGNRVAATASFSDAANAKPITDIDTIVEAASGRGIVFAKALISRALWNKFKNTQQVKDTMLTYYYGPKAAGTAATAVTTLDKVNEYLSANGQPVFELVDEQIGIEKDGVIGTLKPFAQDTIAFIPAGNLGVIKNAVAIEQIQPVDKVTYGSYNRAVISKWQENEPFGEWTKVELNACPALEAIDSIYLLKAIL